MHNDVSHLGDALFFQNMKKLTNDLANRSDLLVFRIGEITFRIH